MNAEVILDSLLSQGNGITLYFNETTLNSILLESLVRGLQIREQSNKASHGCGISGGSGYSPNPGDINIIWLWHGYGIGASPGQGESTPCWCSGLSPNKYPTSIGDGKFPELPLNEIHSHNTKIYYLSELSSSINL